MAKVAGTTGRTRGFQTERSFSMMHDFRQSSEALRLSQVSKMLLQLSGQISAHCSSSEIRNTHLCLFRTVIATRNPAENHLRSMTAIAARSLQSRRELRPKTLVITAISPRNLAKNAKRLMTAIAARSLSTRREIRPKTLSD